MAQRGDTSRQWSSTLMASPLLHWGVSLSSRPRLCLLSPSRGDRISAATSSLRSECCEWMSEDRISSHEERQVQPPPGQCAPLLRLPALPWYERVGLPAKEPPLPLDGAQPGLGQSQPVSCRALPWGHPPYLHWRLPPEWHHADASHAGRPRSCAVRRGDPGDPPPPGHAGHLEPLGQGKDQTGWGRRHRPGAGLGRQSFPVGGEWASEWVPVIRDPVVKVGQVTCHHSVMLQRICSLCWKHLQNTNKVK